MKNYLSLIECLNINPVCRLYYADNVAITAGSGTTVAADEVVDGTLGTVKVQYVKLMDGTLDSTTKISPATSTKQSDGSQKTQIVDGSGNVIGSTSNALDINIKSGNISGFATAAKQPALGTAGTPSTDVLTVQGVTSMTPFKVDGSGVTQPVSGTFWQSTQPVSAASLPLPTGAATSANQTNGSQQTQITDGTNNVNVLKSDGTAAGQNAQLAAGTYLSVPFTTTTAQAVGVTDVGNYRWVSVHITSQGTSSNITFQGSNDNLNWVSIGLTNASNSGTNSIFTSITSSGAIMHGPLGFRYFRLNVTGISAGTTAGTIVFSTLPGASAVQVGTVGSSSATGSAVPANAFYAGFRGNTGNLQGADVMAQTSVTNDASHQAAQLVAGAYQEVSFTTTTAQAVASTDVSNYKWVSVHVTSQGTSSTITFQGSNDNSNWTTVVLTPTNNGFGTGSGTTTTTGIWAGSIQFRYFRLNVTGISAGTTAGVIEFYTEAAGATAMGGTMIVSAASSTGTAVPSTAYYMAIKDASANLTGLITANGLGDGGASTLAADTMLYNNSTYDRQRNNYNTTTGDTPTVTTSNNGATQTNYNARGAIITALLGTVTGTGPTLTMQMQYSPDGGTTWLNFGAATSAVSVATGNSVAIYMYPGIDTATTIGATGSKVLNASLPRTWRMVYTAGGTTPSIAISSVQVNYIL